MSTLFVNKLTNIDFSFLDPYQGLVGESWLLDIQLDGSLNEEGMVLDFGLVKKAVREYVDTVIDHCLVVRRVQTRRTDLGDSRLSAAYRDTSYSCKCPDETAARFECDTFDSCHLFRTENFVMLTS